MNKTCPCCVFGWEILAIKLTHNKAKPIARKWVVEELQAEEKKKVNNERLTQDFCVSYAWLGFIIKMGRKIVSKPIFSCRELLWLVDMQVLCKSCLRTCMTSFQNVANQETLSPLAVPEQCSLSLWNALFSSRTMTCLQAFSCTFHWVLSLLFHYGHVQTGHSHCILDDYYHICPHL